MTEVQVAPIMACFSVIEIRQRLMGGVAQEIPADGGCGLKSDAIDGKTVRGSFSAKDGGKAIHLVSAWATENRRKLRFRCVRAVKTEEKSKVSPRSRRFRRCGLKSAGHDRAGRLYRNHRRIGNCVATVLEQALRFFDPFETAKHALAEVAVPKLKFWNSLDRREAWKACSDLKQSGPPAWKAGKPSRGEAARGLVHEPVPKLYSFVRAQPPSVSDRARGFGTVSIVKAKADYLFC